MSAQNISAQENLIVKRRSTKAMLVGTALVAGGILLYLASTTVRDTGSSIYMLCTVGAFTAMIVGILKLFFGGKETVYQPTKSPVEGYSLYFEGVSGQELVDLIERGRFDDLRAVRRKESGPVRLDVRRSRDGKFVALQVLQYVPYVYENLSGTYCFQEEHAVPVVECIGNPAK
ncbi:hypothetical protein [uncultured Rikenella sp.]|uniref:hypothetical protein n=2 Tax=uncultured Rikenella sp. TaxID=368003 RepID=UPI0025D37D41|nr:hypothetical protein [uncultured Rikenella sp.]